MWVVLQIRVPLLCVCVLMRAPYLGIEKGTLIWRTTHMVEQIFNVEAEFNLICVSPTNSVLQHLDSSVEVLKPKS